MKIKCLYKQRIYLQYTVLKKTNIIDTRRCLTLKSKMPVKWTLRHIVACAVLVSAISATATHVQDAVENVDNRVTTAEIGGATSYKGTCQSFESWPQTDSSADGLRFTEVSIEIDKKGEIQVFHVNHPQWSELAPHPTYISVKCAC